MQKEKGKELAKKTWKIDDYHRGLKPFFGVERCQARKDNVQRVLFNQLCGANISRCCSEVHHHDFD
jgi:hypothetical protein